jgi:hypothetical protein
MSFNRTRGEPPLSSRPSVEALEERSLLDANAFVRSLYANVLHRFSPSDAEVNGWVNLMQNGMSTQQITGSFLGSTERLGVVVNTDFNVYLERNADQQSLNFWVQQMANGMSQDQVAAAILGSQEYMTLHAATNDGFIKGVYQNVLKRAAEDGALAYWTQQLDNGASRTDVATAILGTHEAHMRDVDTIYAEFLGRMADQNGATSWANALDAGRSESDVIGAIINSPEYINDNGMSS